MKIPRVTKAADESGLSIVWEKDVLKLEQSIFTEQEIRIVRGIVIHWISEMGSIYNNRAAIEQENELRRKLGIPAVGKWGQQQL